MAAAYVLFIYSFWVLAVGIAAALTQSPSRVQTAMLIVLSSAVVFSWCSVPLFFHVAQYYAGDGGEETCMTCADEAWWWRIFEGTAKVVFLAVIYVASSISSMVDPRLPPQPHTAVVDGRFRTAFASPTSLWATVARDHLALVLGAPVGTACAVFIVQREARRLLQVDDALASRIDTAATLVTVMAAVAGLMATLEYVVRSASDRAIVGQMLPSDHGGGGGLRADAYDSLLAWEQEPHVTVIFADMVGFTRAMMAASDHPELALATIARVFRRFDMLHSAAAGATKIETAGDEYMSCVGARSAPRGAASVDGEDGTASLPPPMSCLDQAVSAVSLALDMLHAAQEHTWPDGTPVQVRVGIHCGPVLAGVLGGKLPRWGLFGPTPILASRMESHGAPGRVHVSADLARALQSEGAGSDSATPHPFFLEERSPVVDIKGVGPLATYWLSRIDVQKAKIQ